MGDHAVLIIDTHTHAGENWFEPIEVLEFQMDRNGVDKAVLVQHGGTFDINYLFEEAAKRGDRFKVAVLVDPESGDPLGDLEQLAEQGAAGIRLAPDAEFVNVRPYEMWKRTGELGLVVTCQGDPTRFASDEFARVLDACSDTHVVIEHLAGVAVVGPPFEDYEKALELAERDNTSMKVPGLGEMCQRPGRLSPKLEWDYIPPLFEMAMDAFGAARLMWGSDFPPAAGREGYGNALRGVMEHPAFANGDDLEWVMGKTAARVWGW